MNTDLVFVLDESGSITAENFQQVRNFVYNFSRDLLTESDSSTNNRIGVITFDNEAVEHIALNSSIGRHDLLEQISDLPYDGGGTDTADGLELMLQQSWRNDISVLRLAIVITDGRSNRPMETVLAAEAVHNHTPPIAVYAIGVGQKIDQVELLTIASRNETYSHLDSFAADLLDSVRAGYSYQICFTGELLTKNLIIMIPDVIVYHLDSQDVSISEPASGILERGVTTRLRFVTPVADGITFRLCLTSGRIVIYASTIPNPSSAQYGWRDEVIAAAHPLTCLTSYFDPQSEDDTNKRKRRRTSVTVTLSLYITLEGQDEKNEFSFDSRIGNVTLGMSNACL